MGKILLRRSKNDDEKGLLHLIDKIDVFQQVQKMQVLLVAFARLQYQSRILNNRIRKWNISIESASDIAKVASNKSNVPH